MRNMCARLETSHDTGAHGIKTDIPLIFHCYIRMAPTTACKSTCDGKNKGLLPTATMNSGKVTGQDITTNGLICAREMKCSPGSLANVFGTLREADCLEMTYELRPVHPAIILLFNDTEMVFRIYVIKYLS